MPLLNFTVFKEKVLDGTKTQTIRKIRKHPIKKGDKLYLYWHCRQKDCEKLGEAVCSEIFMIRIDQEYWLGKQRLTITKYCGLGKKENIMAWVRLPLADVSEIAERDGFKNNEEMLSFFATHYPLPELFQVIRWTKNDENTTRQM